MKAKIPLLVGGAVGYVLGTRAGRERYEQIKSQAQTLWNNPKVQEKAWAAQDFAKEKAPILKDKVAEAAPGGGSGSGPGSTGPSSTGPSSTGYSSTDPVAATSATGMSATDPLLDPDPLDTGGDSLSTDPLGTDPLGDSVGTDPLSSTPDDRAPFPSSGSGL